MKLLTVKDLIEYLQKQNPKARILRIESNTGDWQDTPDFMIHTVAEEKAQTLDYLKNFFKTEDPHHPKVEKEMVDIFKYANDDDIVLSV
jgi:hypothetical protein